jgi:filamentous hemagglutinin family protein
MKYLTVFTLYWIPLLANPQAMSIVAGEAQCSVEGASCQVIASDRAVLNWERFSIERGETTRFVQPSAQSAVLNRVTGGELSQIQGLLQSNGRVYLMNPKGVVIGPEGRIDTAAFIASALEIRTDEFLSRGPLHLLGGEEGTIVNLGSIETRSGPAILVGYRVENQGRVSSPEARASFAAAGEVLLSAEGNELILIRPQLPSGGVEMGGVVEALQVSIQSSGLSPLAINLDGVVRGKSVVSEGGRIYVRAEEGGVRFGGKLDVSGSQGGEIDLFAQKIALAKGAIDASGEKGGGTIRIGQFDPTTTEKGKNATDISVAKGVEIRADSFVSGDGGRVTLISDSVTDFHGAILARALGNSGDGGKVEISGRASLCISGLSDLRSKNGRFGHVIHDPLTVTIQPGADIPPVGDVYNDLYIAAQLELGNFTITTAPDAGVITFDNSGGPIAIFWTQATTFELLGVSIVTAGMAQAVDIRTSGGSSTFNAVEFKANQGGTIPAGTGSFPGISMYNLQIDTMTGGGSGGILLEGQGGTTGNDCYGIYLDNPVFQSTSGPIEITGIGGGDAGSATSWGIQITSGTIVDNSGTVTLTGTGSALSTQIDNYGVLITTNTLIQGGSDIEVIGQGALNGSGGGHGVQIGAGVTLQTGSTPISITGYGGGSSGNSVGVYLEQGSISPQDGILTIEGHGPTAMAGGMGASSSSGVGYGVYALSTTVVMNDGNAILTGYGHSTGTEGDGIYLLGMTGGSISSSGGNIDLVGFGSTDGMAGGNRGIYFADYPQVSSSTGLITITGTSYTGAEASIHSQSSLIGAMSATIFTTGGGNITLTGNSSGSAQSIWIESGNGPYTLGAGSISLVGDAANILFSGSGTSLTKAYGSGSITMQTLGGNLVIGAAGGTTTIETGGTGSVSLTSDQIISFADGNVTVASSGDSTFTATALIDIEDGSNFSAANGAILFIAGTDITGAGTATFQTTGPSASITFVADNNFPDPFDIGPGFIDFPDTFTFTSNKVNFFAGDPGTSTFPSTINGLPFTPGILIDDVYIPGTNELLGYWYLQLPPPDFPVFQISYKAITGSGGFPPGILPPAVIIALIQTGILSPQVLDADLLDTASNKDPNATCRAPWILIGL